MRNVQIIIAVLFCVSLGRVVSAEVTPGDVIEQSNWQKIQGVVPGKILDLVKQGKLMNLKIGTLNYDPDQYYPGAVKKHFEKNKGKYAVTEQALLVDKQTGKYPSDLMGWPFPGVDENTPNAGIKIAYNMRFYRQSNGIVLAWRRYG